MTKFANNNMTAIELFNKRKEFKNNLNESGYQNLLIDLVYDNPYYGRVNKSFRPVYYNGLSNKTPKNTGSSVFVQDFIADAYDDFIDHIQEAIKLKKIKKNGFINNLTIKEGFIDPIEEYDLYLKIYLSDFVKNRILSVAVEPKIKNYKDFVKQFKNYAMEFIDSYPLTLSSFLTVNSLPRECTGLSIDLSDYEEGDDDIAHKQFYQSPSFIFYVNAARKFGFYVDKNRPSRLVADISSKQMFKYMSRYGITSVQQLFNERYESPYIKEVEYFMEYVFNHYLIFIEQYPFIERRKLVNCYSGKVAKMHIIEREKLTIYDVKKYYDFGWWLAFTSDLKFREKGIDIDKDIKKHELKMLVNKFKRRDQSKDLDLILESIHTRIMKFEKIVPEFFTDGNILKYYLKYGRRPSGLAATSFQTSVPTQLSDSSSNY